MKQRILLFLNNHNFPTVFYLFSLSLLIFLTYKEAVHIFYQQEEWMSLGNILIRGNEYIFFNAEGDPIKILMGQGRVLSSIIVLFFLRNFPLESLQQQTFSISVHILNSVLVFFLARKIFQSNLAALLGSLVFGINSVSHSAVTWFSASAGTLPATTLILVSLFTYTESLKRIAIGKTKEGIRLFLISVTLVYFSLAFKEIGIFLLLLYPSFALLTSKNFLKKRRLLILLTLLIPLIIVAFRVLSGMNSTNAAQFITRILLYPLTSFSLVLIPPETALNFARFITNNYYPFFPEQQFILISQTVVLDLIAVVATAVMCIGMLLLAKSVDTQRRKTLIFFALFLLGSFLPYTILPKAYAYLDSRYYYLASAGLGLTVSWLVWRVGKTIKFFSVLMLCAASLFIFVHSSAIKEDIKDQVEVSNERKSFLAQLSTLSPTLDKTKNAFFITGDRDFYVEGNIVPFQQGFGYTLMVYYYNSRNIPSELIEAQNLFEIGSQGYKEVGNYGFGYFNSVEDLNKVENLQEVNVIKLYYDSQNKRLLRDAPFR